MCVRTSRRWRSLEEEEEEKRNPRITKESLRRLCKEQKLYITPDLNDVLYLHYKGYSKIENLEEYTGLKCLWLENNGIDKIENLDNQKDLRSLYLHNNLIKEIENLEDACPLLDSLNLCHNSVSKIQNLSKLQHLHTLQISHNRLQDFADVEHLKDCKELSCVDLQHNWLDDPSIVDIFEAMPSLRVLYLTGNPVVKKIPFYRKNLTVRCKSLTYLDDRPVFPKDRAAAEAWSEGGLEAEKACRQKWAEDERAKIDASVKGLLALRDKAKAEKYRQEVEEEVEERRESEEEEEEESEESGNGSEAAGENLEAGDSEEISHNGIIFPWDVEQDSRSRSRNELGEGGRSLIVELPDPKDAEAKTSKSVRRKSPKDPEMKNKLHEALLSAEWLQEKSPGDDKTEEDEKRKTETATEEIGDNSSTEKAAEEVEKESNKETAEEEEDRNKETAEEEENRNKETAAEEENRNKEATEEEEDRNKETAEEEENRNKETEEEEENRNKETTEEEENRNKETEEEEENRNKETAEEAFPCDSQTSSDGLSEEKALEDYLEEEEEIEKGALDNLVKEKEMAYHKYVAKTKEEILPNISHFAFGQGGKKEEKSLGSEIEELLRVEKEEMEKARMESDAEKREEMKRRLMEEIEEKLEEEERADEETRGGGAELRAEMENIIKKAMNLLDEEKLINEEEANEVLANGVRVVNELNSIGRLPLEERKGSPPSSEEEFEDVAEEAELTLSEEQSLVGGRGKNQLESQESEEYYSLQAEVDEKQEKKDEGEVEDAKRKMADGGDARSKMAGAGGVTTKMADVGDGRGGEMGGGEEEGGAEGAGGEDLREGMVTAAEEIGIEEENLMRTYKKNITSTIELQIVTESEETETKED